MNSKKILLVLLLLCLSLEAKSFKIGVIPYTNAVKISKIYFPLNDFLSKKLNKNVEVYTSKNYKSFYDDCLNNEFDLIVTGPHMGTLNIQNGFIPIYRYNANLKPVFVVLKDSKINDISQLKNTKIALSTELSVSSMGGIKTLINRGFENGKDFELVLSQSHTSAIKSVVLGDVTAAITTYTPIKQLTDKILLDKIKIIESDINMPHLFLLMGANTSSSNVNLIKTYLKEFEKSEEGKTFFKTTGYKGLIEISDNDLSEMIPLLDETKKYLEIK